MRYLIISNSCNMNCDHCYLKGNIMDDNVVTDFEKIQNNILKDKPESIILYGYGEPLFNMNIKKLTSFCKVMVKNNIKMKLQTNLIYDLTEDHIELFKLLNIVKISFDIGIRYKSFGNLLKWFNNLKRISKVTNDILLEITIHKQVVNKDANKWNNFLNHLLDRGYIKKYMFHDIQYTGNANIFNNRQLLEISRDKFVPWMNTILSNNRKENRTIDEFAHNHFFYKYNLFREKVTIIGKDGNYYKDYIVDYLDNEDSKYTKNLHSDCLLCDNYNLCGGRSENTECLWDKSFIQK